ncbi:MAG: DUF2207 domain-containing protein [Anaerolineae bacterium]|nr:DUF2207 domain-containing protein [Anaerolineae bacterium]
MARRQFFNPFVSRFLLLIFCSLFLVLYLLLPVPVSAQSKTFFWERLDVEITVLENGDFLVQETQVIQFTSGTFTYGYRAIPAQRLTAISDVQVWEDGQPCPVSVAQEEGEYRIRWEMPAPRSNSRHVYVVRYLVHGGLRYYEGGDQLWWKAVFPDRSFPVRASTVTVRLPEGAVAEKAAAYFAEATVSGIGTNTVVFEAQEVLDPGQEMEVRVQFPHGIVQGSPAAWQLAEDAKPLMNLGFGLLGGLFTVGGPLLVLLLWYLRGRDPVVKLPTDYLTEPPSDAPPGVAGALVDEKADLQDILATLVDLARRGYLQIEERAERGWLTASSDFVFRRTDKPDDDLLPYEKVLLSHLLGRKGERRLSELKNRFYTAIPEIQKGIYEQLVRRGYFRTSPEKVRTRYTGLGATVLVLVFIAGLCIGGPLMGMSGAAICPFLGLGATAVALIVAGRHMPVKTRKGAEEAARWRAFKRYLQEMEKYTDVREAADQFEKYLPYAIAFGVDRTWVRRFARVEDLPMPVWYIPSPLYYGRPVYAIGGRGPGLAAPAPLGAPGGVPSLDQMSRGLGASLDAFSRGLGSMLDSAASVFVSAPSSARGGGWSGGFGGDGGGGGFG